MGSIVSGAVIASNGKLTEKFEYISDLREANMNGHSQVNGDFKSDKKVGLNKYTTIHYMKDMFQSIEFPTNFSQLDKTKRVMVAVITSSNRIEKGVNSKIS